MPVKIGKKFSDMKKGFTLIELLIVVVVIVTLMAITFRLAGVGGESTARNKTINRMQRLENCLSGYYAAYGSYPPVKLHGSRDYTLETAEFSGIQNIKNSGHTDGKISEKNWLSIDAACRSQPLAFSFPFPESMVNYIEAYCERQRESNPKIPQYTALWNNGTLATKADDEEEWHEVQLYKYGLMSYLLPRLLVTMKYDKKMDEQLFTEHRSWTDNNELPSRFEDGAPYPNWAEVNNDACEHTWKIAALPSQAVCARWLPNLEGSVTWITSRPLYGVDIRNWDDAQIPGEIYFAGGYGSQSQPYKLNTITVKDGYWNESTGAYNEFYYYSRPPYQSYRLWSAGPNCRTFVPWMTEEELSRLPADEKKTVQNWVADDIVHMSN